MRLVDDARQFWRWWSVRAAAAGAVVMGWAVSSPQQVYGLLSYVPDQWRPAAGAAVGLGFFVLPTLLRVVKQEGKGNV